MAAGRFLALFQGVPTLAFRRRHRSHALLAGRGVSSLAAAITWPLIRVKENGELLQSIARKPGAGCNQILEYPAFPPNFPDAGVPLTGTRQPISQSTNGLPPLPQAIQEMEVVNINVKCCSSPLFKRVTL
jgi:hypothetical protein